MADITVKAPEGGGNYEPVEAGSYAAICYGIIDIGTTYNQNFGTLQTKVLLLWELPDETIERDGETKPKGISKEYTLSLNEKSTLYKDLAGWRGKAFTDEEMKGFKLSNILGKPCLINVVETTSANGKTYSKVQSVSKVPKGMTVPEKPYNTPYIFNIQAPEENLSGMDKLPEWIQKKIKESDEYKERTATPGFDKEEDFTVIKDDEDLPF